MDVKRAYRYRFYPTPAQETTLAKSFGCARLAYNHVLPLRSAAWFDRQERMGYHATSAALTALKKIPEHVWRNELSSALIWVLPTLRSYRRARRSPRLRCFAGTKRNSPNDNFDCKRNVQRQFSVKQESPSFTAGRRSTVPYGVNPQTTCVAILANGLPETITNFNDWPGTRTCFD